MQTNWYVFTGGPSSGKTTLLEQLRQRGYRVVPEAARALIDQEIAKGKTIQEIRKEEKAFQESVLQMKIKIEGALPQNEVIFFDRAIPDTIAYCRLLGLDTTQTIKRSRPNFYKRIFLTEQLPLEQDYARTESFESVARLNVLLREAYEQLHYEVTVVPVMSVEDRIEFVLQHLEVGHRLPHP